MPLIKFNIHHDDSGRTIFKYLIKMMDNVPISRIEKLFRNKDIKINDKRIKEKKEVVKQGDVVYVYGIDDYNSDKVRYFGKTDIKIIYEDKNIILINKDTGISMHDEYNSLDTQVLKYLNFVRTNSFKPSHVGRLDKSSSGIVAYCKNYSSLREMNSKNSMFKKIYIFKSDINKSMDVKMKIEHNELLQKEVSGQHGKESHTIFTVDGNRKIAELVTGRKHQIRSTLSKLGYPIYGDRKYGGKSAKRLFLHSYSITYNGLEGELAYLNGETFICEPV